MENAKEKLQLDFKLSIYKNEEYKKNNKLTTSLIKDDDRFSLDSMRNKFESFDENARD